MSANYVHAKKMHHQAEHFHEPGVVKDFFDRSHYRSLLKAIVPNATKLFYYFSDEHNIALGFLTNGFAPFNLFQLQSTS